MYCSASHGGRVLPLQTVQIRYQMLIYVCLRIFRNKYCKRIFVRFIFGACLRLAVGTRRTAGVPRASSPAGRPRAAMAGVALRIPECPITLLWTSIQ